jgi:peroxiredoxin Q/BCP
MRPPACCPLFLLVAGCATPESHPRAGGDRPPAAPRSVEVGDRAPKFELALVGGGKFTNVPESVTLIVFWATWSQPDLKELVSLEPIWRAYAPRGLRVVAISVDEDASQLPAFALTYHLTLPIASDERHVVADTFRPSTDPTTYLVDAAGTVRAVWHGYHGDESSSVTASLDELLPAPR